VRLGALLLLWCSSCSAAELSLTVSTLSWHFERETHERTLPGLDSSQPPTVVREARLEHENWGAGVGYELSSSSRLYAGAFRNSSGSSSRYLMASHRVAPRLSIAAGYLDGYGRKVPLGAAAVLELGVVRLVVLPAEPAALSLWFELPL
jgi:hypothetical protein